MQYPNDIEFISYDNYQCEFYLNDEKYFAEYTIDWDYEIAEPRLLNLFTDTSEDLLEETSAQLIEDIESFIRDNGNMLAWDQDRMSSMDDYYYDLYKEGIL